MVYLYPAFKDMQLKIEERADTHQITTTTDVLGEISFADFDEFIAEVRNRNQRLVVEDTEPETFDIVSDEYWSDADYEIIDETKGDIEDEENAAETEGVQIQSVRRLF